MNEYQDFTKAKDRRVPTKFKRPKAHDLHDTSGVWAVVIMIISLTAFWLIV